MESVQDHLLKSTYIFKIAAGEFVGWPICYGYKILQSLDKGILYSGGRWIRTCMGLFPVKWLFSV